ncbi:cytochrome P450 306a1 [Neodiprion pinetum]|uniref:cytochrome P450 306a1 n=1 Tax=Neodiprion pinetum TaxID=441929 RepID=UPI001EDD1306|nr:cytochrome P450 306a1 [Neodiprion pinetum]XP_046478171.1 cytochrome P450 306a1 [Neodiprion pinetum]XP_046478172.1 cytochrome P450 306a1 [Neodiprion pinetum]XP_046478173.1 cytochrome P450 306a1 [Neodiprion pinetum]XP_046478174.1 cytochrome P450 306a1 [Neodiprion pinetum]XP_046478175.1 cytochrome P450 306a1 [Neodiprion pinetum]XP_046478176.1 cytochrome P450 306a1 [Neodiprion pinetum]
MSLEYIVALCLFLAGLVLAVFLRSRRTDGVPPGPWGLPILGFLPWINPDAPHESFTILARKYGPVCGLRLGSLYTVLISEAHLVRQALAKDSLSGRAPLFVTHGIMHGYGLICADGDLWREQRKFVVGCLRNLGMVKIGSKRDKMESRILTAVEESVSKLKQRSANGGVDPYPTLHHCMGNLMNLLVFGRVWEEDDETWRWLQRLQEDGVKHIGVAGPLNFLPFLRHVPKYKNMMRFLVEGKLKTHDVYRAISEDRRKSGSARDSVLAMFEEETKRRLASGDIGHFSEPQKLHLLADLFGAGTDTTLTTLRWLLLFLAAYPREQDAAHNEMKAVLGPRPVELKDRPDLPRLEAVIAETQRIRSVVPVGIPHGALEDSEIGGYLIPKGTMIVPLQWAIHMDPKNWKDPEEFRPARFIADDGSFAKPENFLPFQNGKRICVGEELAKMTLFLFAGRIIQSLKVSLYRSSDEAATFDLSGESGITLTPKHHRLIFSPRAIEQ